jgi:S1-C subfamily serine protease
MDYRTIKNFLIGLFAGVVIVLMMLAGVVLERTGNAKFIDRVLSIKNSASNDSTAKEDVKVVDQESVVTRVVEQATPSVVTVSISKTSIPQQMPGFDFFNNFFNFSQPVPNQQPQKVEQDIGTGFIISSDGLIVTNKHVVADTQAKYKVVVGKDLVLEVKDIYRDPTSDLAILKVDKTDLKPVAMGDSDHLKVGQTVIAIGTALGEFRSTVTTGVISGLGRGIVAGTAFEGSEKLDNVIQTDAAINPGNSGGPLFNSSGEVIGINVAVSQSGQNIGFALPINLVKESISNFKTTGEFDRPYLGVSYQMISKQSAILNEVPAGAYVQEVISGGPAEKGGVKVGDIITEIDGNKVVDNQETPLATYIGKKKIGDSVTLNLWRDGKSTSVTVKLEKLKQ